MHTAQPSPSLLEVQRWIAARVLPASASDASRITELEAPGWLATPGRGTLEERLSIYANGYPARLRESLSETFPAVEHLLGPQAFTELTERYIGTARPTSYNLNHAGSALSLYLESDEITAQLPFIPDLAELEWKVACAFHGRERRPLDATSLPAWSAEQWQSRVLRFQASVAIVRSDWPILDLLQSTETPREEIDIQMDGRRQNVLVFRKGTAVRCETVDAGCAEALVGLLAGQSLGNVSRRLDAAGVAVESVARWFAAWMQAGIIVDCAPAHASL